MKAAIYNKYGPPSVLSLVDFEKPSPKSDEILVKICATTVTSGDVRLRSSDFPLVALLPVRLMFGVFGPRKKILGHELSGVVEAVGKDVIGYKVGDEIVATPTQLNTGAYVEYICIPQVRKKGVLSLKPKNLSFDEAAALPVGGLTALFLLIKAKLSKGQNVLVYGASGSVGSYAIQIAKAYGASVVAVCSDTSREMMTSLGVDRVVDYKKEDYTSLDANFDIVIDAVGKTSKADAKKVLNPQGTFVSVSSITSPTQEHMNTLVRLVEQRQIEPYIDKFFEFSDIVTAHEYVDSGRKKGNVVVRIHDPHD